MNKEIKKVPYLERIKAMCAELNASVTVEPKKETYLDRLKAKFGEAKENINAACAEAKENIALATENAKLAVENAQLKTENAEYKAEIDALKRRTLLDVAIPNQLVLTAARNMLNVWTECDYNLRKEVTDYGFSEGAEKAQSKFQGLYIYACHLLCELNADKTDFVGLPLNYNDYMRQFKSLMKEKGIKAPYDPKFDWAKVDMFCSNAGLKIALAFAMQVNEKQEFAYKSAKRRGK